MPYNNSSVGNRSASTNGKPSRGRTIFSVILFVLAILYDISPIDIIPDIPVVGWTDDFFLTATTALNLIETLSRGNSPLIGSIAKTLKWLCIIVGTILVILAIILGATIADMIC